ncbi:hypothetical protein MES5069_300004 [Mesorhizobium escarrei]|uniref:Uncharacterized protein n=1 Tax=Mesorhizobium escarrei TaxID=666018 RepID=A0ABN8JWR3_9HYPH|nr:hypothetical protein MES5069_300004 [Mesorhizobium escarrei]
MAASLRSTTAFFKTTYAEEWTVAEVGRIVSPQGPLLCMHRKVWNGSWQCENATYSSTPDSAA